MYAVIVHLGADGINRRGIHGCISHYAELSDAAARHKYVKTVVSYYNQPLRPRDCLGKLYQLATPSQCEGE